MVTGWVRGRSFVLALALCGSGLAALSGAAHAQEDDARLRKIEAEVRALQRTVFPGGDGRYFTPEVIAPDQAGNAGAAPGATTAVTDMLGRLDSIEAQLQRLTAETEQNTNAIAQLSARLDTLEAVGAPPPPAVAADAAPATAPAGQPAPPPVQAQVQAQAQPQPVNAPQLVNAPPAANAPQVAKAPEPAVAKAPAPQPAPQPEPKPAAPSPERLAAVSKIVKPQTKDPGEDEYSYGFRLWDAKFYPEAQQQLQLFVDKYPKHARISFARNLLGRAYLDDGKLDQAATWFYENYNADRSGDRAPDSLLYLAETMIAKKDTKRACVVLAEFGDVYPALASGRLQAQYKGDTAKVDCRKQ